ncbi:LysM peptidoglycan-binding domain-containing protein [Shimia sp. R9_1]|uniref:LysM peptidoglycan-binding domain-containing protein n=1 Tax=Shimia sp. R9_1 TaxID=2821111 RepID=UPI001ADA7296|nr:LysM peptidoglycan-binding domain-containing protein [Shimia sp. R9_1]MBO9405853.1 LysM peptidoglycan-binding domain-containing protein [Shimia sp. R9_1]
MTEKASGLSGNIVWVAGVVVAMGVSVYALVATGVLDGSALEEAPVVATEAAPAPQTNTSEAAALADTAAEPAPSDGQTVAESETAPKAVEQTVIADAPEPEAAEAPTAEAPTNDTAQTAAVPVAEAPTFDLVRVDAEGNTVVAGAAAPNAVLAILLDGVEIATSPADSAGQFAAILSIAPSDAPRVLSLVERRDAGDVHSDATVIVAPVLAVAAPVPTATEDAAPATDVAAAQGSDTPAAETELVESETAQTEADVAVADAATAETVETAEQAAPVAAAPKAPAVIVSDSQGVRVLHPAAPADTSEEVLAAVSIDSISYTDTGAVMVSGRGAAGLFVRLYLNNALAAEAAVDARGMWSSQLADVAGGLYEMRADEVDKSGKVTSRVLTPFKRETPETVAQARAQADATAANQKAVADAMPANEETTAVAPAETVESAAQPVASVEQSEPAQVAAAPEPEETVETAAATETAPDTAESAAPDVTTALEAPSPAPEAAAPDVAQASEEVPVASAESAPVVTTASTSEAAPSAEATKPAVQIVTVQPGSSLWAIARDRYGEGLMYVRVFEANKEKIQNPDLIYPGQVFAVPEQ